MPFLFPDIKNSCTKFPDTAVCLKKLHYLMRGKFLGACFNHHWYSFYNLIVTCLDEIAYHFLMQDGVNELSVEV